MSYQALQLSPGHQRPLFLILYRAASHNKTVPHSLSPFHHHEYNRILYIFFNPVLQKYKWNQVWHDRGKEEARILRNNPPPACRLHSIHTHYSWRGRGGAGAQCWRDSTSSTASEKVGGDFLRGKGVRSNNGLGARGGIFLVFKGVGKIVKEKIIHQMDDTITGHR